MFTHKLLTRTCFRILPPRSLTPYNTNIQYNKLLLSTQQIDTDALTNKLNRLFSSSHTHSHTHTTQWHNPATQPLPTQIQKSDININVITMEGKRIQITGHVGETLLDALKRSDVGSMIPAQCGGGGAPVDTYGEGVSCRSCHVYVDPSTLAKLPPKSNNEEKLTRDIVAHTEHTRFSCEVKLEQKLNDITVVIPEYRKYELDGGS